MSTEENKPLGIIIQKFDEFELIIDSMIQNYNQISTKLNILVIKNTFNDHGIKCETIEHVECFLNIFKSNEFKNYFEENTTTHFGQSMNITTKFGVLIQFLKKIGV